MIDWITCILRGNKGLFTIPLDQILDIDFLRVSLLVSLTPLY